MEEIIEKKKLALADWYNNNEQEYRITAREDISNDSEEVCEYTIAINFTVYTEEEYNKLSPIAQEYSEAWEFNGEVFYIIP